MITVIGVGNDHRGDDAAGLHVIRHLEARHPKDVIVRKESGEGARLMESWVGADAVIVVDSVHSGCAAGTIHRLDVASHPVPSQFSRYSSHAFSVAEAVELARVLKILPQYFLIYGIEGKNFKEGSKLSVGVRRAIPQVLKHVLKDLSRRPS